MADSHGKNTGVLESPGFEKDSFLVVMVSIDCQLYKV